MFTRLRSSLPSTPTLVAFAALLIAVGGVARATIPSADGTIAACYDASGAARVIDDADTCGPGETKLRWNQAGVPGPAGPQGAAGPVGPPGAKGPSGLEAYDRTFTAQGIALAPGEIEKLPALDLPAGTYLIESHGVLQASATAQSFCTLVVSGNGQTNRSVDGRWLGTVYTSTQVLGSTLTIPYASQVRTACTGKDVTLDTWRTTAVRLSGIVTGARTVGELRAPAVPPRATTPVKGWSGNDDLSPKSRANLQRLIRRSPNARRVLRAQVVLLADAGVDPKQIAATTGLGASTVSATLKAYLRRGLPAVQK